MKSNSFHSNIHSKTPVMVWYHYPGSSKILSQLIDISSTGMSINAASYLEKGILLAAELQLPTSYPELTKVEGMVSGCDEIIPNTLYHLHISFAPMTEEAETMIDFFISKKMDKSEVSSMDSPKSQPNILQFKNQLKKITRKQIEQLFEQFYEDSPEQHQFHYPKESYAIFGNNDPIKVKITSIGFRSLFFEHTERLTVNTSFSASFHFSHFWGNLIQEIKVPVIINHVSSTQGQLFQFEAKYKLMDNFTQKSLFHELLFLILHEQGEKKVLETLIPVFSETEALTLETGHESRRWDRVETKLNSELFDEIEFTMEKAFILDLSLGGAKIKSSHFFLPNSHLLLKTSILDKEIRIPVIAKWGYFLEQENAYVIGLQFENGYEKELKIVEKYLEKNLT